MLLTVSSRKGKKFRHCVCWNDSW